MDQAKISSLAAANYTNGGEATYEGSTVAFAGRIGAGFGFGGFEGDVAATVDWTGAYSTADDPTSGIARLGRMTAAISNFAQTENGDPLRHENSAVRELVFSAAGGGIEITPNAEHEVMFGVGTPTHRGVR